MFDLDYLNESADSREIAEAIGMETRRKGKYVFCECPSHKKILGREDHNLGNCILTNHGYHCFACGANGSVFDMVMDFKNCSFFEAVKIVAGLTGGDFTINDEKKEVKRQPFSQDDLELIGLQSFANPKSNAGKEVIGVSKCRPESGVFFRKGDEYVLYSSTKRITLNQLFAEDEKLYYQLIIDNAQNALEDHRILLQAFEDRGNPAYAEAMELLSDMGALNAKTVAEMKNVIRLNIKKIERIIKEAEHHV